MRAATIPLVASLLAVTAFASPASAAAPRLAGPPGVSASKVLVIGTDGTRIDLVDRLAEQGAIPRLADIAATGFSVPSLLAYAPPEAATLSEVGWSTIATGVWPAKHGVRGYFLNMDPGQATKNGYLDFLSLIERERPQLSTFLASDWANIGLHESGGPIFGDSIDARSAVGGREHARELGRPRPADRRRSGALPARGEPGRRLRLPRHRRRGRPPRRLREPALPPGDPRHRPPDRPDAGRDPGPAHIPVRALAGDRDDRPRPAEPHLPLNGQSWLRERPRADVVRRGFRLRARGNAALRRHPRRRHRPDGPRPARHPGQPVLEPRRPGVLDGARRTRPDGDGAATSRQPGGGRRRRPRRRAGASARCACSCPRGCVSGRSLPLRARR